MSRGVDIRVKAGGLADLQRRIADAAAELGRGATLAVVMSASPRRPYPTVRPRTRTVTTPTNGEVFLRLRVNGHGLSEITVQARGRLIRETVESLRGRGPIPNTGALWLALAGRWRALLIERVETGGGDLAGDTNDPRWTAYKARLGLSTQRLQASGQLLAALRSSTVEIRKR